MLTKYMHKPPSLLQAHEPQNLFKLNYKLTNVIVDTQSNKRDISDVFQKKTKSINKILTVKTSSSVDFVTQCFILGLIQINSIIRGDQVLPFQ
jgi:hypothetical protein